jgi:drug/metabolite transporter (DMT)-like permease
MPSWLVIVIAAHLLNAVAFLVDKFLLSKAVPLPTVYAFFVGVLGSVTFVLLPFDFQIPTATQALVDFAAGATFVLSLYLFFTALKRGEASRIVPYIGGTIPVWTLVVAYLTLGERLSSRELVAFGVLVVGSAMIAQEERKSTKRRQSAYAVASFAAFSFAVSTVLMKAVFLEQSFISGFVWSRAGAVITALSLLLHTPTRQAIFRPTSKPSSSTKRLFLAGQVAGALGFFTLQYAVSMASPTLVNAMQGVQYAFLFGFIVVLGRRFPQLRERLSRKVVTKKILAIIVIGIGLALLGQAA